MSEAKTSREVLADLYLRQGKSVKEIADIVGQHESTIRQRIKKLGLTLPRGTVYSDKDIDFIRRCCEQNIRTQDIARALGRSEDGVQSVIFKNNLRLYKGGEALRQRALTVRRMYNEEHMSVKEIADAFLMTEQEMQNYLEYIHVIGEKKRKYNFKPRPKKVIKESPSETLVQVGIREVNAWFHKCKLCGKEFAVINPGGYTYKCRSASTGTVQWFCKYTHYMEYRSTHKVLKKGRDI